MSEHWLVFVPVNPRFAPTAKQISAGTEFIQRLVQDKTHIKTNLSEGIRFIDCGENFESVTCPACGVQIKLDWWSDAMSKDYIAMDGRPTERSFQLANFTLPNCGHQTSLDRLIYKETQVFAKFSLEILNPDLEALSDSQMWELEGLLGCEVTFFHKHL